MSEAWQKGKLQMLAGFGRIEDWSAPCIHVQRITDNLELNSSNIRNCGEAFAVDMECLSAIAICWWALEAQTSYCALDLWAGLPRTSIFAFWSLYYNKKLKTHLVGWIVNERCSPLALEIWVGNLGSLPWSTSRTVWAFRVCYAWRLPLAILLIIPVVWLLGICRTKIVVPCRMIKREIRTWTLYHGLRPEPRCNS